MNSLNNEGNSERNFRLLLQDFERICNIDNSIERKFELIKSAKGQDIDFEEYYHLFEEYERNVRKNKDSISTTKGKLVRIEIWLEKIADSLSRMAIFQILEYFGKFSIVIAAIIFIWEIPSRVEQANLAQKRTHYEAWSVVNNGIDKSASLGRQEALEFLNKEGDKLSGLDIKKAVLENIKLPNATLKLSKMIEAVLIGSDFTNASLDYADFSNAYLWRAKFNGAHLGRANFSDAELDNVELDKDSDLLCTKFVDSKNLTFEQLNKGKNWASAVYDSEFQKYLREEMENPKNQKNKNPDDIQDLINRLRPKTEATRFNITTQLDEWKKAKKVESLNLVCAEFDKKGEDLSKLDLTGADLSYAILKNVDFRNTKLKNANLLGADLDGAQLDGADIEGANLDKVKFLTKTQIKKATNWEKAKFDDDWKKILFDKSECKVRFWFLCF